MRKNLIEILLALILTLTLLVSCGASEEESSSKQLLLPNSTTSSKITSNAEEIDLGVVPVHTEMQKQYLSGDYNNASGYANGKMEVGRPKVVKLEWDMVTEPGFKNYKVYVSKNKDYSNAFVYETTAPIYNAVNFEIGTDYFVKVVAVCDRGEIDVAKWKFTTEPEAPRNLSIPNATNVRDMGGYVTEDGRKIKQGLLFRGARLNHSAASGGVTLLTDEGTKYMHDLVGLKSEIDLRRPDASEYSGIAACPVPDVQYFNVPMLYSGNFFEQNRKEISQVFKILSKEENYPAYFHCHIGTDRTGFVAFVVGAVCGMKEEDLYRDYLFSNFGNIGGARTLDNIRGGYLNEILATNGETLAEKAKNALMNYGVPEADIDAVVNILVENN